MADSPSFEFVCDALEGSTPWSGIEARGTVRLALKKAGLEAATITAAQMQVVVHRVLPDELKRRAVEDALQICETIANNLVEQRFDEDVDKGESPEAIFARLG